MESSGLPTAVDRFSTLWEIYGEAIADATLNEAARARGRLASYSNRELRTLHELIENRLIEIF
jgi:hypothetical protein